MNPVGCHYTPKTVADEFINFTIKNIHFFYNLKSPHLQLSVLDLFAGDGRLGNSLSYSLSDHLTSLKITFVEVDNKKIKLINPTISNFKLKNINVFEWHPTEKYDVIISNPPYQKLDSKKAKELGFSWAYTKKFTQNLYGLSIIKSLELCKEGGIVSVIAPFGWLCGIYSKEFRKEIKNRCSNIKIQALTHRGLFDGINQDIGFQVFKKRRKDEKEETILKFKYDNSKYIELSEKIQNDFNTNLSNCKARVGPIVWNQKKKYLSTQKKKLMPLIYGGNIKDGKIKLNIPKYYNKQYIYKNALSLFDISKPPLILMRRTLRGKPGDWKIDSCLKTKNFRCVCENHVIVIETPFSGGRLRKFHNELVAALRKFYFFSGTPSISVQIVNKYVSELLKNI